MKTEILDIMEERKAEKDKHMDKYERLSREVKERRKAAKEEWLNNKCQNVE